jgi:hypothetical protein
MSIEQMTAQVNLCQSEDNCPTDTMPMMENPTGALITPQIIPFIPTARTNGTKAGEHN